jgi:hypothetical protein
MLWSKFFSNLFSPQVLFFCLGLAGAIARSDLEFPSSVSKMLSFLLLLSIGFKGGLALAHSGASTGVLASLVAAVCAAMVIPLWVFFAIRRKLGVSNAAAVAASFGAVSSVTFLAACAHLAQNGTAYSGHMVAALALMDAPAILVSLFLVRSFSRGENTPGAPPQTVGHLFRGVFLNGSVFLLVGSLLVGILCSEQTAPQMKPLIENLFPAVLSVFLLDMGLAAGRRLGDLPVMGKRTVFFALGAPLINAVLGLALALAAGLGRGDAFLLVVLCASASYIAAPAAIRSALPEASPGVYLTLALGLVFPFNLVFGLPMYRQLVDAFVR